ncbi:uncharacterized protein B0T23DRAFT_316525, partial [Neurospora hispaniola]
LPGTIKPQHHFNHNSNLLSFSPIQNGSQDTRRPRSLHGPSLLPVQDHARHQQLLLPLRPPPVLLLRLSSIASTPFEHLHWADPKDKHRYIPPT